MSDVVDVVVEPTAERTWAAMVLLEQEMSPSELRAILTTHDPKLVRRFIELHRERLEEGLLTQRRCLAAVERILTRDTERQAAGAHSKRRLVGRDEVHPGSSARSGTVHGVSGARTGEALRRGAPHGGRVRSEAEGAHGTQGVAEEEVTKA